MAVFEGKTTTERNKIIAAALLGVLALGALYFAFGRSLFGSTTTAASKSTPTPKPNVSPGGSKDNFKLPTNDEQTFNDVTTLIVYRPGNAYAPDASTSRRSSLSSPCRKARLTPSIARWPNRS